MTAEPPTMYQIEGSCVAAGPSVAMRLGRAEAYLYRAMQALCACDIAPESDLAKERDQLNELLRQKP